MRKKILLFSTLSPYPFWAGSETFWFDFVTDERVSSVFDFHLRLADSPVTRRMADVARASGASASFYKHFNVHFLRRNISRVRDRVINRSFRTFPWYDKIKERKPDLVWFSVDGLHNLQELEYASAVCLDNDVPYWIVLQHGFEDFFLTDERSIEAVSEIAVSARRFIFIAKRNQRSLERAIGRRLDNAFYSANALADRKIREAKEIATKSPVAVSGRARFFNLGRFSPESKAQHRLLEAFTGVGWQERDWGLSFVGVSDQGRKYLERMIVFFGLDPTKIDFVQFTNDVFAEIARHDVLLMPSLAEGTPYAMIESMACGRPAMGTPVGGIPELIEDGENGWLARTTDVSDIADSLERMWTDRLHWRSFGDRAQKQVETNNNEAITIGELLARMVEDIGGE